jgi:Flp pilus assembly protein TadG
MLRAGMRNPFDIAWLARDDRGQSIVETALMLPILIFLVLAGGDMARGFAIQIAIQNGARAGAEAAAINFSPSAADTEERSRDEMSRTPGMDGDVPAVTVTFARSNGTSCAGASTLANPCFVTVRVQMTWHTITAWPLIPNTFNFDRTTAMRMLAAP